MEGYDEEDEDEDGPGARRRRAMAALAEFEKRPVIIYRAPGSVTPEMRQSAQLRGWTDLVDNPVDLFAAVLRSRVAASSPDWSMSNDIADLGVFYALTSWLRRCPAAVR